MGSKVLLRNSQRDSKKGDKMKNVTVTELYVHDTNNVT